LNAYGSRYGNALPTQIPPAVVTDIQSLCYEIYTYINDNLPNIEEDNLNAFYTIFDRNNALVTKLQQKEQGTTQFYRDLRILIADLRRISLALIPTVTIANQVLQSNFLTNHFN
jgi:hypothetical protein